MLRKATAQMMLRATVAAPDVAATAGRIAGKIRTAVMAVAGFGAIDYGIWQWNPILGWIAGGVSLLALEALTEGKPKDGDAGKDGSR
jgi:hypothetical protein